MARLGEEIRRAREAAGLTQEALADRAGIHRTYVSLVERDKKSPTVAMLLRICHAIGVRPSTIVAAIEGGTGRR